MSYIIPSTQFCQRCALKRLANAVLMRRSVSNQENHAYIKHQEDELAGECIRLLEEQGNIGIKENSIDNEVEVLRTMLARAIQFSESSDGERGDLFGCVVPSEEWNSWRNAIK